MKNSLIQSTKNSVHNEPKISVVIPTYKRSQLLARAIHSVLNQTESDFEIVVIDDGSLDDTEEVVKSIPDPRIRFFSFTENKGGSAARNKGVELSRGKYIAFLDSDDVWLPQKLEKQYALAGTISLPSDWFIYNAIAPTTLRGSRAYTTRPFKIGTDDISTFLIREGNYVISSGLFMERCTALKHPFDESLRRFQDTDLVIRMVRAGVTPFLCTAPNLVYGDDAETRISSQLNADPIIFWLTKMGTKLSREARACLLFDVFLIYFKKRSFSAVRYIIHAFIVSPRTLFLLIRDTLLGTVSPHIRLKIKRIMMKK